MKYQITKGDRVISRHRTAKGAARVWKGILLINNGEYHLQHGDGTPVVMEEHSMICDLMDQLDCEDWW